jgi:hypothetical protein
MERTKDHYAWFKLAPPKPVVAGDAAGARKGADDGAIESREREFHSAVESLIAAMREGMVAPSSVEPVVQLIRNSHRPPRTRNGPRPPGRYAGSTMSGWWLLDSTYQGVPSSGLVVDFAPVPGSRDDAIAWLDTGEGRDWLVGAVTYFLMCFTARGDL